ncbi:hypothetical protein ANN_19052 [Periplaneta americana]|uniref:Uncharacterized protein n=1 Tax=Periplaneta americana TaxID=6978 RepID=A0ABQ8SQF2_PERAM|nr:hypothetical protein ANN_19052 [Periplaneta americana]
MIEMRNETSLAYGGRTTLGRQNLRRSSVHVGAPESAAVVGCRRRRRRPRRLSLPSAASSVVYGKYLKEAR